MNLNGVYSRNNLPKIKHGAYVINLDEYELIETHWIAWKLNGNNNAIYFDSFGVERISIEIRKVIGNKTVKTNIYRIRAYDSIVYGYLCIWLIDFMLKGKSLLEYTNLFSPDEYEQNDEIVLKYFQQNLNNVK